MNTLTRSYRLAVCFSAVLGSLVIFTTSSFAQNSAESSGKVDFWSPGDAGQRMDIRGQVTSLDGTPIAGAIINIRQADGDGVYSGQYSGSVMSNQRGNYQFGSVVPGNYTGERHVHVFVEHEDYRYLDTEILFKDDPNLVDGSDPRAVFLEEGNVNGEKMMFGRFDIVLLPQ